MTIFRRAIWLVFILPSIALGQDLETELPKLATTLASVTTKASVKKISVLDFTDLQQNSSELGRYIAEQLSIALANSAQGFSVMNRANLKSILDEHKLTASGLVNPDNARKLGQFAGVDAIVMGSLTPFGEKLNLTAQIVSTETAQVIGGATTKIVRTKDINELLSAVSQQPKTEVTPPSDPVKPVETKDFSAPGSLVTFQDVHVELISFRFNNHNNPFLTFRFVNHYSDAPIKIGINSVDARAKVTLVDENGSTFPLTGMTGIEMPGKNYLYDYYQSVHQGLRIPGQSDYVAQQVNNMYDLAPNQQEIVTLAFDTGGRPVGTTFRLVAEVVSAVIIRGTIQTFTLNNVFIDGIKPKQ